MRATFTRKRFVRANADDAFALLADLSRLPEYNPFARVEASRVGACEPGDTCTLVLRTGPFRLRVRLEVTAVGYRRLQLRARSVVTAYEQRLVEEADDGCWVSWTVEFRVPWWLGATLSARLVFLPLAARNIEVELEGVRRILEGANA